MGHHIVLNYVDRDGRHHTLQGMPEHPQRRNVRKVGAFIADGVRPDGVSVVGPPFGRLRSWLVPDKRPPPVVAHTMIAEGDDLSSQWTRMKNFGDEVNATGYEYHPTSQNRNSFAAEALRRGGFFGPGTAFPEIVDDRLLEVNAASGETRPLRVPAFSARLKNPINVFEHRFTRWPRADAGAPDPSQPASNPNDSFDGPGINRPIRYLSRNGASPGQAYGTGTSDAALPAAQAFAPGRPTTFDDRFANWTDSDGVTAPLAPHRAPPREEDNRPRGIFSGKPMPNHPVPPPVFGFPEPGAPDDEDWLLQLLAPGRGR